MPDFINGCEPENGISKSGWTPHDHYMIPRPFIRNIYWGNVREPESTSYVVQGTVELSTEKPVLVIILYRKIFFAW